MTDNSKQNQLLDALAELKRRQEERPLELFQPYGPQRDLIEATSTHRELCIFGGNQTGKSAVGAHLIAVWSTGLYPPGWKGRRFSGPIRAWVVGVTSESARDSIQAHLIGLHKPWGSSPKAMLRNRQLIGVTLQTGVRDAADTIHVQYKSGGTSTITFKSASRGREALQGASVDILLWDEEPPDASIYSEGMARIAATRGVSLMCFTPLKGASEIVRRFTEEEDPNRFHCRLRATDAKHFSDADIEILKSTYGRHEWQARLEGLPMTGSGMVYPVSEETLSVEPFAVPPHWPQIVGIDFGVENFAAVRCAYDRDSDSLYLIDEIFNGSHRTVEQNALEIITKWGRGIPVTWPHDGNRVDPSAGRPTAALFREFGVNMLSSHATDPSGSTSLEASVAALLSRMQTGRLRVFSTCGKFFKELSGYHRSEKDGRIVPKHDHILDSVRYASMSIRAARTPDQYERRNRRRIGRYPGEKTVMARDIDYPLFS